MNAGGRSQTSWPITWIVFGLRLAMVHRSTRRWRHVARGMVYGFFLWAITLKVAPSITTAMLERLGSSVADHHAYDSVMEQ